MGVKKDHDTKSQQGQREKKAYRVPRLITYGGLRQLTRTLKSGTKSDGPEGRGAFFTRT